MNILNCLNNPVIMGPHISDPCSNFQVQTSIPKLLFPLRVRMMKSTLNRMFKPWTREALGTKRNPGLAGWFIPNISKAKGIWVCMHAYGLAEPRRSMQGHRLFSEGTMKSYVICFHHWKNNAFLRCQSRLKWKICTALCRFILSP